MKGLITKGHVLLSPGYMVNKGCLYPGAEFLRGLGIQVMEDEAEVSPAEVDHADELSFISGYLQNADLNGKSRIMLWLKHFGPAPSLDHLSKATGLHRTWAARILDQLAKTNMICRVETTGKSGNPVEIHLTKQGQRWQIGR